MMMTAIQLLHLKYFIVGASNCSCKQLQLNFHAVVSASPCFASKEQVESLGAKFVFVESDENLETEGSYAKEATEFIIKKQEELNETNSSKIKT